MIFELDRKDYPKVENLFNRLKTNTAIESIFNFKNEARLFVDNTSNPGSVFVLNSWAYYYLAGDSEKPLRIGNGTESTVIRRIIS